ncbi:MAG: DNA-processing protein DprA [Clostridia bacterium]|nr:DNA-processing protein DprA [Clostridia bacterium]
MDSKKLYWLWLQGALGPGARTDEITAVFPSPEKMYLAGEIEWKLSGVLTKKQIEKLSAYSPKQAQGIAELCNNNGWQIITPDDATYPRNLRNIRNFPLALFVQGDISKVCNNVCVAVVGTRKASFQGSHLAHRYAAALSHAGICVVSGAALGIDSAAHNGSLSADGPTAAVLGCGFGVNYLMENRHLRDDISKSGALITEFPPGTPASPKTFPVRNRIISGLSEATIVIEAGIKSGSLITANFAMEQGRDVFAPPGDVFNSSYAGANRLIKDGARPLFSIFDVIEEYALRFSDKIRSEDVEKALQYLGGKRELSQEEKGRPIKTVVRQINPQTDSENHGEPKFEVAKLISIPTDLSDKAKTVYDSFGEAPLFADEIAKNTGLAPWEVISALTELELADLVCLCAGKRYKKI